MALYITATQGDESRHVADALRSWLAESPHPPRLLGRGLEALSAISPGDTVVLPVTLKDLTAPELHFQAGALWGVRARVLLFLIDTHPENVPEALTRIGRIIRFDLEGTTALLDAAQLSDFPRDDLFRRTQSLATRLQAVSRDAIQFMERQRALPRIESPDREVRFTAYHPFYIGSERWQPLLVYAHVADLLGEVEIDASKLLHISYPHYSKSSGKAKQAVPRGERLTICPVMRGVEYDPPKREFQWIEPIHREDFRCRFTGATHEETHLEGSVRVYAGPLLLAELPIHASVGPMPAVNESCGYSCPPYRKVFPSYSHKDAWLVDLFERFMASLGDSYLRDVVVLRAGVVWSQELLRHIEEANVFQLFWSWNSMDSKHVEREWRHALALERRSFVRPHYWEMPMPRSEERGLPPPELLRLQFHYLDLSL